MEAASGGPAKAGKDPSEGWAGVAEAALSLSENKQEQERGDLRLVDNE